MLKNTLKSSNITILQIIRYKIIAPSRATYESMIKILRYTIRSLSKIHIMNLVRKVLMIRLKTSTTTTSSQTPSNSTIPTTRQSNPNRAAVQKIFKGLFMVAILLDFGCSANTRIVRVQEKLKGSLCRSTHGIA